MANDFVWPKKGRYSRLRVAEGEWNNMMPEEREELLDDAIGIVERDKGRQDFDWITLRKIIVTDDADSIYMPEILISALIDDKDMREFVQEDLESYEMYKDEIDEVLRLNGWKTKAVFKMPLLQLGGKK